MIEHKSPSVPGRFKRLRFTRILAFALCLLPILCAEAFNVHYNTDMKQAEKLFGSICNPATVPVSFKYGEKAYTGLKDLSGLKKTVSATATGREVNISGMLDQDVRVELEGAFNKEFGEVEYTLYFTNTGKETSKPISDLVSIDRRFSGKNPVVRGCYGDHGHQYAPYSIDLGRDDGSFESTGGRATHGCFPYFDLVHGSGGTLIALGWGCTWKADFKSKGSSTRLVASNCTGLNTVLKPGETIRTALVVMLPYTTRDEAGAWNLWRAWFTKYNMPKADASGALLKPFSTTCFAGDTGLPNSDGSISERFYTWRRTLDRLVYEDTKPDFRWFDAGWYFDPEGNSPSKDWWGTVGSWELDTIKWPGKTFRESNEACHKVGIKVLMWFEPERVTNVDALARNYGYRPEWAISNGHNVITNNLGDKDCLAWTLNRIIKVMGENEVDMYREDNNSDPATTWPANDAKESAEMGAPRTGISENLGIQGHYALWDGIIDFCARNGKCTFVDNCASGGGRNDIESLRRSVPLLRSDSDRSTSALRLAMTSTFNKWVPFCGSSTKESVHELEAGERGGASSYVTRASWLPSYNISECYTHDETMNYDRLRKNYGEWRRYSHLLLKDFYVLTPLHSKDQTDMWTVFAYHDQASDEAVVLTFRQETCPESDFTVCLPFADPDASYTIMNEDTQESFELTGRNLATGGYTVHSTGPRFSAVWHMTRKQ